jgi:hypothetical protein
MIFNDPNNRGRGRLTKPEIADLGSILASEGHNPHKEVAAEDVLDALLLKAAKAHDEKNPGSNQAQAAQNFLQNRP